jgi:hypothetical protein
MTFSLIKSLNAGAPPPKVMLLPDALFFVRAVTVAAGATPADVTAQAELALEALSPFPPAQLYHGFYWVPGAAHALVYAAYRRRFTSEQLVEWEGAELVLPVFAALLGKDVQPSTTVIATSSEGLTAICWEAGPVPAKVLFRPVAAEATDEERARVRDELIREVGGTRHVVDLKAAPVAEATRSDREFVFGAGEFRSRLPAAVAAAADVRDRIELAALRRARARDVLFWRVFVGCAALILLLGLGEAALVGAALWQKTQLAQANAQRPLVEKIMTAQSITTRIKELSTRRLLPIEMIRLVGAKKPDAITFLRTTTGGLYSLTVDAKSTSPAAVSAYQTLLTEQPFAEKVEVRDQRSRDSTMTFTLVVTFRPAALAPATPSP